MYIDEQSKIDLNGVPQFVSIRAEKENSPLLVYLHGGSGAAALPLVRKSYNTCGRKSCKPILRHKHNMVRQLYLSRADMTLMYPLLWQRSTSTG